MKDYIIKILSKSLVIIAIVLILTFIRSWPLDIGQMSENVSEVFVEA